VIEKLLTQKTYFNYDILVIDSGSTDGTYEHVSSMTNKHKIRLFRIPSGEFGHGKTRNYGANLAKGDYLVFITADALPADDKWLQNLIKGFNDDNEIAGVFGKHIPYENCLPVEKHIINSHFNNYIGDKWQKVKITDWDEYNRNPGWFIFFSTNNACIRKTIWKKIPFPEVHSSEDQYWAKEILFMGYAKAYANDAIVYHSHKHTIRQILKRYFDEYKSYASLQVENKANIVKFLKYYLKSYFFSIKVILNQNINITKKLYWIFYYLTYDFSRSLGYYFGTNYLKYERLAKRFSLQEENIRRKYK
jgi:rhamnosyltransferase